MHCPLPPSRWLKSSPHLFGLVVAALVLAVPQARDQDAPSGDVEGRVHVLEGRMKEVE